MSRNLDKECAGQGQLSSAWDWGWVMGYGLWVMGYGKWVMGNGLWVMGNWSRNSMGYGKWELE